MTHHSFVRSVVIGLIAVNSSHAETDPEMHIEFMNGTPIKILWRTEPNRTYDLWMSEDLNFWTHVDGFPKTAQGVTLEHSFTAGLRGFFKIGVTSVVPDGFTLIPSGEFTMGRTSGDTDSVAPPVTVNLSAFYISRHEVTKTRWDDVRIRAATNGYADLPPGAGKAPTHPIHSIDWYASVKWCNARSELEGLTPCYTVSGTIYRTGTSNAVICNWNANGYRLPTEAEWEKAARGGINGKRFPWGEDTITHSQANYNSTTTRSYDISETRGFHPAFNDGLLNYTAPVGSFAPNGYGVCDMAGNVSEWCWDWFGSSYYSSMPGADPHGPASGTGRVIRDGSYYQTAYNCRAATRGQSFTPAVYDDGIGFRLARSLAP